MVAFEYQPPTRAARSENRERRERESRGWAAGREGVAARKTWGRVARKSSLSYRDYFDPRTNEICYFGDTSCDFSAFAKTWKREEEERGSLFYRRIRVKNEYVSYTRRFLLGRIPLGLILRRCHSGRAWLFLRPRHSLLAVSLVKFSFGITGCKQGA